MSAVGEPVRVDVCIGGITVGLRTTSPEFVHLLHERYAGFIAGRGEPRYEFDVVLQEPAADDDAAADVRVWRDGAVWRLQRGDFRACWDPATGRGRVRQSCNPYAIDSVLRIVHTLVLAGEGGFLLHAASALRGGKAFVFAGVSGAGKTTLSRLAPADVHVLTDEVSYVRREGDRYIAYGTPFAGELARAGENLAAPLDTVYLLHQGPEHRIEPLAAPQAARALLANVLFFARDAELVRRVFLAALDLVERVSVQRLTFRPEPGVWELVR